VVILNYTEQKWLERCLAHCKEQTIFNRIEVIVADNLSTDGPTAGGEVGAGLVERTFPQNGENLGFCEGNNRGAKPAIGEYLFFLNNDTWLEPPALKFCSKNEKAGADAATPWC